MRITCRCPLLPHCVMYYSKRSRVCCNAGCRETLTSDCLVWEGGCRSGWPLVYLRLCRVVLSVQISRVKRKPCFAEHVNSAACWLTLIWLSHPWQHSCRRNACLVICLFLATVSQTEHVFDFCCRCFLFCFVCLILATVLYRKHAFLFVFVLFCSFFLFPLKFRHQLKL